MSTISVHSSALTAMAPPRARLVSAQKPQADSVQLSGLRPREAPEAAPTGASLATRVVAGVGLALALTGAAVACGAPSMPPPAIVQVQANPLQPISPESRSLMKEIASPSLTDNLTANQVRNRYGAEVDEVLAQARSFAELHERLVGIGQKLEGYAEQYPDGGSLVENGAVIGVEKANGRVTVTAELPDSSVQQAVRSRHSLTVSERDALGHTTSMEETARSVRVSEDGTSMTMQRQSGRFEVSTQQGPRRSVRVTVEGASIKEEVRETIPGFAGMIENRTTTRYEVPETSIMVYPRVEVTETRTRLSDDGFGNQSHESTRTEVYDNGSTKTFERGPDGQERLLEQDGPAILIAQS